MSEPDEEIERRSSRTGIDGAAPEDGRAQIVRLLPLAGAGAGRAALAEAETK